jgi:hypothetical protein
MEEDRSQIYYTAAYPSARPKFIIRSSALGIDQHDSRPAHAERDSWQFPISNVESRMSICRGLPLGTQQKIEVRGKKSTVGITTPQHTIPLAPTSQFIIRCSRLTSLDQLWWAPTVSGQVGEMRYSLGIKENTPCE